MRGPARVGGGVETSGARNVQNTKICCEFFGTVHHYFERSYNSGSLLRYNGIDSLINYSKGSDYRLAVAGLGVPSLLTLLKSVFYSGLFKNILRIEDYTTSKDIAREDLKGI
jgi:hypothetical protein